MFRHSSARSDVLPYTELIGLAATAPAELVRELDSQLFDGGKPMRFDQFQPQVWPEVQYIAQPVHAPGNIEPRGCEVLEKRLAEGACLDEEPYIILIVPGSGDL